MGLETGVYISDLVVTNPTAADPKSAGDDHLRLLKSTIKTTFPNVTGAVTATQVELNIIDGATLSTAELNVLDGMTASTAELNILDGATLTTTELNYVDGVTSAIQTQLNAKADITGEAYSGVHDFSAAGSVLVPTPTLVGQAVNKSYADGLSFAAALPAQVGNSGKIVSTDGTTASWVEPSFGDDRFRIKGSADATKIGSFEIDTNVPTGTNVVLTWPAASGTIARTSEIVLPSVVRSARISNTILGLADKTLFIDATTAGFTQTLTAAATLLTGWYCYYRNSATTGNVTLDPDGAELIDGAATKVLVPGQTILLQCDGTAFRTIMLDGGTYDSYVLVGTPNGVGSTNTKIRRYTTTQISTGAAITYADSATLGATFTINEPGVYAVTMMESVPASGKSGVSLNGSGTVNVEALPAGQPLAFNWNNTAGAITSITSAVARCIAGDVLRPHTGNGITPTSTQAELTFSVRKISA